MSVFQKFRPVSLKARNTLGDLDVDDIVTEGISRKHGGKV